MVRKSLNFDNFADKLVAQGNYKFGKDYRKQYSTIDKDFVVKLMRMDNQTLKEAIIASRSSAASIYNPVAHSFVKGLDAKESWFLKRVWSARKAFAIKRNKKGGY